MGDERTLVLDLSRCVRDPADVDWTSASRSSLASACTAGIPQALAEAGRRGLPFEPTTSRARTGVDDGQQSAGK